MGNVVTHIQCKTAVRMPKIPAGDFYNTLGIYAGSHKFSLFTCDSCTNLLLLVRFSQRSEGRGFGTKVSLLVSGQGGSVVNLSIGIMLV